MKIDVYKLKNTSSTQMTHIMIKSGTDLDNIPTNIRNKLGQCVFVRTMDIRSNDKRIALDSAEAISNIEIQGYHIQKTNIELSNLSSPVVSSTL